MAVKPIPDQYPGITPYLIVRGAAAAIDFYKRAFGAVEMFRMDSPSGRIGHAEIKIRSAVVMLADEHPEMGIVSPATLGGAGVGLLLYVEDCDRVVEQAVAAGAKIERPLQNQFYGDRSATIIDPFGHKWTIATHIEDVSPEEMATRMEKLHAPKPA